MYTYFKTETEDYSIGKILSEKDMGLCSQFLKKPKALFAELNDRVEEAIITYSARNEFLQYIYSAFEAKNHQKIRSRCLAHEFSFIDFFYRYLSVSLKKNFWCLFPYYMAVASYCYYEKVRRTNARSLSIFILFAQEFLRRN